MIDNQRLTTLFLHFILYFQEIKMIDLNSVSRSVFFVTQEAQIHPKQKIVKLQNSRIEPDSK